MIDRGMIRQVGTPEQIFRQPASEPVARFIQMKNIFAGRLVEGNNDFSIFRLDNMDLIIPKVSHQASYACIRPEEIAISNSLFLPTFPNQYKGTITNNLLIRVGDSNNVELPAGVHMFRLPVGK